MKKIQNFVMAFLLGAMTIGFTACSSDNGGDGEFDLPDVGQATTSISSSDKEMQKVAKNYVQEVVYPTYQALASNARTLYSAAQTLYKSAEKGTMTQDEINAACEAFKNTRQEWERSEAFLFGSATDNELDPHIDSWPLDRDELERALTNENLIAGFKSENPAKFVSEHNTEFQSVLGFHGMEFVLFRNGAHRTVEALKANDTDEGVTSVKGIDELAFLQAVAADVRNITALLEFTWMGSAASNETKAILSGEGSYVFSKLRYNGLASNGTMCFGQFLLSPSSNTGYQSWQGTMNQIFVGGCSNICAEVADQKLGQAYRVATGQGSTTDDSKDYIESPYSHRSFIDYQDNIYSIKNSLYGTRDIKATTPVENSMLSLLKKMNYPGYNNLINALNAAIQALETAKNSGKSFVEEPGAQRVKDCIDAVDKLDKEINNAGSWINLQDAI
ncbi:imelysin family protein [uncultured Prevotella sp.]|uniref:imelysin family protein n=1 Tax=uncultured Prevotella sp. TaxID=159272 RepID=UPI0027E38390|nr:imelysin family protein [uncultured Prevotella sp.]